MNKLVIGGNVKVRGDLAAGDIIKTRAHEPSRASDPPLVMISYSRRDEEWRSLVLRYLADFTRRGDVAVWDDHMIGPGSDWEVVIAKAMDTCSGALLLVSPAFLESKFVRTEELPVLLSGAKAGRIALTWALLEDTPDLSQTTLGAFQAAHHPLVPLASRAEAARDQVLKEIAQAVAAMVA